MANPQSSLVRPAPPPGTPQHTLPQKRKLSATELEIPDSDAEDDEDYGWADEDEEELPPPPPQWQGSEDALAPPLDAEDEQGDEELLGLAGEEGGGSRDAAVGGGGEGEGEGGGGCETGEGTRTRSVVREEIDDSEDELAL